MQALTNPRRVLSSRSSQQTVPASGSHGRWWEAYLVRYGIGTVIGSACVKFMLTEIGLLPAFYLAKSADASIDIPTILLLGILGLAYCYLASAPGLVIHAARHHIIGRTPLLIAIASIFCLVLLSIFICPRVSLPESCYVVALGAAFVFFIAQGVGLWLEWRNGTVHTFYQNLHRARQSNRFDPDSYRHLREHGNAFFIVILELILLSCLLAAEHFFGLIGIGVFLFFWILPAAAVYFLGHKIEAELLL